MACKSFETHGEKLIDLLFKSFLFQSFFNGSNFEILLDEARVTLARACYNYDKDVYLLDDPLGAVDPHGAKHLVNKYAD